VGITVWAEGGYQVKIKTPKGMLFSTVIDDQGRVYLANHEHRIRVLRLREGDYYLAISERTWSGREHGTDHCHKDCEGSPLFLVKPMLRLQSVLKALG
jgi:DNA topoisomerase IB